MSTLNVRDTDAYLSRIGAHYPELADTRSLASLQLAHMLSVPFENLDIHRGVPIVLDGGRIIDKVAYQHRGGYCYELNSAFGALLDTVGYSVDLVSARVARAGGRFGAEFDHMALIVRAGPDAGPLLVDVGFGDAFTRPIPLTSDVVRQDRDRMVRLIRSGDDWIYEENRGDGWQPQYMFTTKPRTLSDFAERNHWQQTSPDSHFTARIICSLLTADGRVTISGNRFIVTVGGERSEQMLLPSEIGTVLGDCFGIRLASAPIADGLG
jgi:N-hydroxyarylamine O-acetyltransferase